MADVNLTHSPWEKAAIQTTVAGQFYFGGTGPQGARCGHCASFRHRMTKVSPEQVKRAEAQGITPPQPVSTGEGECMRVPSKQRRKFPAASSACKYFDNAVTPPPQLLCQLKVTNDDHRYACAA